MAQIQHRIFMIRVDLSNDIRRQALIDHLIAEKVIYADCDNETKNAAVRRWLGDSLNVDLNEIEHSHQEALEKIAKAEQRAEDDKVLSRAATIMAKRAVEESDQECREEEAHDDAIYTAAGRGVALDRDPEDLTVPTDC